MFRQARKRFLNFWAITGLIFSGILTSFIVHDMMAQDVSGGASSSTSVVTGTDEECKEPGRISGIKCIVHTHHYTKTTTDIDCYPAPYKAPTDDSTYCIKTAITVTAKKEGTDTVGKTIYTYGPCMICGAAYPGTNPDVIPHSPTWPTVKWDAGDCGADPLTGSGLTATFTAKASSSTLNSSNVVFSTGTPGICERCGSLNAVFNPAKTSFTVEEVKSLTAGRITSKTDNPKKPETLYLANIGWDNTPEPNELSQNITATLKPDGAEPTDDKKWDGAVGTGLTAMWKSKEFKIHDISYGCTHSKKAMKIAVEGASIVSAVPDSDEENTDKYLRVFVNEDFTKDKDVSTAEAGHHKCKVPDNGVDDYEPAAGRDELVGFSLAWFKYEGTEFDDTDAKLQLSGYSGNAKIYLGSNEDDMKLYDGEMKSIDDFWKIKGCMRIEGTAAGTFTLQLNMQTRDTSSTLVDQVKVKVIPLNIVSLNPAPSSDPHEICYKSMCIQLNDNDSDNDQVIDLEDTFIKDGDPDLATVRIMKPEGIVANDMGSSVALTLPLNIKAYKDNAKKDAAPLEYAYSAFDEKGYVEIFLEGTVLSGGLLDSPVKVDMQLKDGSMCRDEVRYTVTMVDLDVDSDNNNGLASPDRSKDEDKKEYVKDDPVNYPGKIFQVDDGDLDADGIPDFADGFNRFSDTPEDDTIDSGQPPLIPIVVEKAKFPADGDTYFIFRYVASNPDDVQREEIGRTADNKPIYKYTAPAGLRIWKTNANTRKKEKVNSDGDQGDFVPANEKVKPEQIGLTGEIATLYFEGTPGAEGFQDCTIVAELHSISNDKKLCEDVVRVRPICMQFVTKGDNDEIVPTDYVGVCTPRPEVKLIDLTEADVKIHPAKGTATVTLKCDEILDPVADNLPPGVGEINKVEVFVDGSDAASDSAQITADRTGAPSFWKQHPYKGAFKDIKIDIPLTEGMHTIKVQTTENAAGLTGYDEVCINLTRTAVTSGGGGSGTFVANIYIPQAITDTTVDSVQYYSTARDPLPADPTFTELPDAPASSEFNGLLNNLDASITITNFAGLTSGKDTLTAEVPYGLNNDILYYTADFTETKKDSRIFRTTIDLNSLSTSGSVKYKWGISSIDNSIGSGKSVYTPGTLRFKGLKDFGSYTAKLKDFSSFKLDAQDGWYYLKGGSLNMLVNIYDDNNIFVVYYDDNMKEIRKNKINIASWELTKDNQDEILADKEIKLIGIEIDGDYNRNGVPVHDKNKTATVDFMKDKGTVVLVNCNDDDGDNKPDSIDTKINGDGVNDKADMSSVKLSIRNRDLAAKLNLKKRMELKLNAISAKDGKVSSDIRIFPEPEDIQKEGGFEIKLDYTKNKILIDSLFENDRKMLIEGINFSEEVIIRAEWKIKALGKEPGYSLGSDEFRVLTSPWMGLSNNAKVSMIYANNLSDVFVDKCKNFFGNNLINSNWSMYTQDLGEFGFTAIAKDKSYKKVILNTGVRSNFSKLISKDIGYAEVKEMKTEDGGTIDFLPPNNDKCPFGKILFGYVSKARHEDVVNYLNRQKVQGAAICVDTSWLKVGHLDEIVSIIPQGNSFKIIVGDLADAIKLLEKDGDPNDPIIKEWLEHYKLFADQKNKIIKSLDETVKRIKDELKNDYEGFEIIRIPVLYTCDPDGSKVFGSNSVNMAVANINGTIKILVPNAYHFLPIKEKIASKLKFLGKPSSNGNWDWVDTQELIQYMGEAHCSTNTLKEP